MGGLLHLVQRGWAAARPSPLLTVPNVTAHPSTAMYQLHIIRCSTIISSALQRVKQVGSLQAWHNISPIVDLQFRRDPCGDQLPWQDPWGNGHQNTRCSVRELRSCAKCPPNPFNSFGGDASRTDRQTDRQTANLIPALTWSRYCFIYT